MNRLQSINERIKEIPDFPSTIKRINELNNSIVDKIAELSDYYADRSIVEGSSAELYKREIDDMHVNTVYWPILSKFLEPGKNKDNDAFLEKYLEFQDLTT